MALVFDIETIGENFDKLDVTTQESLTRWIRKESQNEEEYRAALEDMKNGLGFSPLTGEIVVIGVFDSEKDKGAIYYQAPGQKNKDFEDNGIVYRQCAEKEMLEKFWEGAKQYNEFISFNGRAFDVPFIIVRSAVHGIRPTKDLMYNRYINSQRSNAVHIDLLDQLSFYGTVRKKGNLQRRIERAARLHRGIVRRGFQCNRICLHRRVYRRAEIYRECSLVIFN